MTTPVSSGTKIFVLLILLFGSIASFAQCKQIDVEAKVIKSENSIDAGSNIVITYRGASSSPSFTVNLFGPNRKNELDVNKTTFENLEKGDYIIIIVGKREEDNYCPKSIKLTIN
ncbi:MAG: hypothetical protein ABJA70_03695 [Chryseolinea sp.]